ncbi:MAG: hypothetical protein AAF125_07370, partial [Chloroflexota bacterium]
LGLFALVGLIVTTSLNVHAAGVVFAVGFSVWAVWRVIWAWLNRNRTNRDERRDVACYVPTPSNTLSDAVALGVGALTGTILFYLTNILPVGGVGTYLAVLGEWDGARRNPLFFYTWESFAERVLILGAIVWLAWRRKVEDRFLLSAIGFTVLGAWLMDTQGYIWHFGPLYFLAVGVFLSSAFVGRARGLLITATIVLMTAQVSSTFIDWGTVRQAATTGTVAAYFYNDLKAELPSYVTEDDVIYSTHQLIWIFPHTSRPNVVSYGAEREGMDRWGLDQPVEVWERVEPNVIVFVPGQMAYDPGMIEYMDANPFQECAALDVQGQTVTVLRRDCAAIR